jgi:hypothetical protein
MNLNGAMMRLCDKSSEVMKFLFRIFFLQPRAAVGPEQFGWRGIEQILNSEQRSTVLRVRALSAGPA